MYVTEDNILELILSLSFSERLCEKKNPLSLSQHVSVRVCVCMEEEDEEGFYALADQV